jgi:uncharacterized protein (DUF1810 family)
MATANEFLQAQDAIYHQVLRELAAGRKQSHWIWFIFPQLAGLGTSSMTRRFALHSPAEARAYLAHPVLGQRLRECTRLMLKAPGHEISAILDYPDDLKFRSSMTLFAAVADDEPIFTDALQKFFDGQPDPRTIELLRSTNAPDSPGG